MALPPRWRWKLDQWRERAAAMFRSEQRPGRPRLCPACSTLVGSTATKCHQCGASLTFSLAAASRWFSGALHATSPVTYFILGLSCLLYGVSLLATIRLTGGLNPPSGIGGMFSIGGISSGVLGRLGESLPLWLLVHQPWRLVTAIFLHGSLIHIAFNMMVLMDIGPALEEAYGSARYLFQYVTTGAVGFVLSAASGHLSVGASGALMGLIGVMLAITTRRGGAAMRMLRSQLVRWLIYIFLWSVLMPGIDNAAHLGGLATGYLLGLAMADREPATAEERTRAYALGWLAGIVVAGSFAAMFLSFFPRG